MKGLFYQGNKRLAGYSFLVVDILNQLCQLCPGLPNRFSLGGYKLLYNLPFQHFAPGAFCDTSKLFDILLIELRLFL